MQILTKGVTIRGLARSGCMNDRNIEVAPCGVYCAACPSFNKSCLGCASENRKQKRISKWACTIRQCCYEKKEVDYCGYCNSFPCDIINKRIIKSHEGDKRFKYRHEVADNMGKIKSLGVDAFIRIKKKDYECDNCGGSAYFYHYKCNQCGKEVYK